MKMKSYPSIHIWTESHSSTSYLKVKILNSSLQDVCAAFKNALVLPGFGIDLKCVKNDSEDKKNLPSSEEEIRIWGTYPKLT